MLHRIQRLPSLQPNVSHVRDIKNAHTRAHRHVLGDDPARRRILHRHLPAVKLDHLRAHRAMHRIQRSFSDSRRGVYYRQFFLEKVAASLLGDKTLYRNTNRVQVAALRKLQLTAMLSKVRLPACSEPRSRSIPKLCHPEPHSFGGRGTWASRAKASRVFERPHNRAFGSLPY